MGNIIGRGKYSQVYAAVHIATGRAVAMKKVGDVKVRHGGVCDVVKVGGGVVLDYVAW